MKRFAWALLMLSFFTRGTRAGPAFDEAAVDALVREALRAWHVPGVAVAIVHDDRVVYLKGFGVRELGRKQPVTADTLFPLGSCTKAFTTTAMAMLVDEGKMHWDDPVRKHLDYFHLADPLADANVTLRDLVTHRTGLGHNDLLWYRSPWSLKERVRRIGLVKPAHSFRSTFEYQTTMFTAAGLAVAHAAGMPWANFVQKRIFDPLGMTDADFTTTAAQAAPDHASPHSWNADGKINVIPWYEMDHPDPAGSINASARALSQWVRFQLGDGTFEGKRLVSAAALAETHTPQMIIRLEGQAGDMNPDTNQLSYGMAWVIQDYRGQLLVSHAGAIDGFRAHITLVPKAKWGIVLLNNLDQTQMNLALSNNLVDLLLGLPRKDWHAYLAAQVKKEQAAALARIKARAANRHRGTKPSRELAAYAGTYEDAAYGTARVSLDHDSLVWKWGAWTGPLQHYHYDVFMLDLEQLGSLQVIFTLGPDGEVASMKVLDMMDVEFKRVKAKPHP